jgi:hypothetical protein
MTLPKFELDTTRLKGLDDTAKAIEIQRQFETWKATLSPSELEHFTAASDRQIPELIFYALVILLALVAYCSANRSDVDANMKAKAKTSRGARASPSTL